MKTIPKKSLRIILLILLFTTLLRTYNLGIPDTVSMDEFYYVPAARALLSGEVDPNLEHHPPLAKEIIAAGMYLFGDTPVGWRIFPVIFGEIGILLTYILAKKLFRDETVALLSMFLLSLSSLWFVLSRTAMLDIFMATFLLLSFYLFIRYCEKPTAYNALFWGISLGLTLASKWTAILIFILLPYTTIAFTKQKDFRLRMSSQPFRTFIRHAAIAAVSMTITYFASYLPHILNHGFISFLLTQWKILSRHLFFIKKEGGYSILAPFAWPFIPAHALSAGGVKTETHLTVTTMLENPLLLWTFIPALVGGFVRALKTRHINLLFISSALAVLYIPWLILDRPKYFYYMLPIIPLLCCVNGYFLTQWWNTGGLKKAGVMAYMILLIAYFSLSYPLLTGTPMAFTTINVVFFFWKSYFLRI